jgi:hypothetical protein
MALAHECPHHATRRLARKAESARQARLRHKQFVTDLQGQAAVLHARIRELEAHCTSGPGSAAVALRELKSALTPEQQATLNKWCAARPYLPRIDIGCPHIGPFALHAEGAPSQYARVCG